jgi:hypothetical protein
MRQKVRVQMRAILGALASLLSATRCSLSRNKPQREKEPGTRAQNPVVFCKSGVDVARDG